MIDLLFEHVLALERLVGVLLALAQRVVGLVQLLGRRAELIASRGERHGVQRRCQSEEVREVPFGRREHLRHPDALRQLLSMDPLARVTQSAEAIARRENRRDRGIASREAVLHGLERRLPLLKQGALGVELVRHLRARLPRLLELRAELLKAAQLRPKLRGLATQVAESPAELRDLLRDLVLLVAEPTNRREVGPVDQPQPQVFILRDALKVALRVDLDLVEEAGVRVVLDTLAVDSRRGLDVALDVVPRGGFDVPDLAANRTAPQRPGHHPPEAGWSALLAQQGLNALGVRVEREPDALDEGRLARPAGADDARQPLVELHRNTLEVSARGGQALQHDTHRTTHPHRPCRWGTPDPPVATRPLIEQSTLKGIIGGQFPAQPPSGEANSLVQVRGLRNPQHWSAGHEPKGQRSRGAGRGWVEAATQGRGCALGDSDRLRFTVGAEWALRASRA